MEECKTDIQNDRTLESFFTGNNLRDYILIIRSFPSATAEENRDLVAKYKKGDSEARDLLIKKNLRLILSVVYKIAKNSSSDEKLEHIQNGVFGLMRAIEKYDETKGSFSTYAEIRVKAAIYREKDNTMRTIRRPPNFLEDLKNYNKFLAKYENSQEELPDREEIKQILGVTEETLTLLERDYLLNVDSLDKAISDDKDSDELIDFIANDNDSYNELLDNLVDDELLKFLKITFAKDKAAYYVLYHRVLNNAQKTLEEIAEEFSLTRERARQIEAKALRRVRKLYNGKRIISESIMCDFRAAYDIDRLRTRPVSPKDYYLYFFIRDSIDKTSQEVLKELLFGEYEFATTFVAKKLKMNRSFVKSTEYHLRILIKKALKDPFFAIFSDKLSSKYKSTIFRANLDEDISALLEEKNILDEIWGDKGYEDLEKIAEESHTSIPPMLISKLKKYFRACPKMRISINIEKLERDINFHLFGFALKGFPVSKLYSTFLLNMDKFGRVQTQYLLAYKFHKIKQSEFLKEFGNTTLKSGDEYLIDRLLLLHYGIRDYKGYEFDKNKYLQVRDECLDTLDSEEIRVLDLYFGVYTKPHTIKEIVEIYRQEEAKQKDDEKTVSKRKTNIEKLEQKIKRTFRNGRDKAMNILVGQNQTSWDKEIYRNFLRTSQIDFAQHIKTVVEMYFIDDKTYPEIAKILNISVSKVRDYVKEGAWKIDYYRFGIASTKKSYSSSFVEETIESSTYDDKTKEIMRAFIKNGRNTQKTCEQSKLDTKEVDNATSKLYIACYKRAIESVTLTGDDIENAIMTHESINFLTSRERSILSMHFGFKNVYNPEGIKKDPQYIMATLNIKNNLGSLIRIALEHIKGHKIGLYKTPFDFVDRKEMEDILREAHLPISKIEKDIIIKIYGLYGTRAYSLDDLAKELGMVPNYVRIKIYRTIVNIRKYQNGEIRGWDSYEEDVKPYLKFFIMEDRKILECLYRDSLPNTEIAKKFDMSEHQMTILILKMKLYLKDLKNGQVQGLDFDYFWSTVEEEDIPFYGDKNLATELFYLYYEMRMTAAEIERDYHPELSSSMITRLIEQLTAAVIKRQHGFIKGPEITHEEVTDYYKRHENEMGIVKKSFFLKYFARRKKFGPLANTRPSSTLTHEIIKEKYDNYFTIGNATQESVESIIKEHGNSLPANVLDSLGYLFDIDSRLLMTDAELAEVYGFLKKLKSPENKKLKLQ